MKSLRALPLTLLLALTLAVALAACGSSPKPSGGASTGSSGPSGSTTPGQGNGGSGGSGSSTTARAPENHVASKSPTSIVATAVRAIDGVRSVRVSGALTDNGIPVRLDLHLVNGQGGEGDMSENGLAFKLIAFKNDLYIQGSDAFWTHFGGATAAKVFHDKWLKAPNSGQFASIGALASVPRLFGQLLTKHGKLTSGHRSTVDGQPAIGVVDRTGGGTLYVATTGQAYPLEIVKQGRNGGHVTFDDFNQPVTLTRPAHPITFPKSG